MSISILLNYTIRLARTLGLGMAVSISTIMLQDCSVICLLQFHFVIDLIYTLAHVKCNAAPVTCSDFEEVQAVE